MTDLTYAWAGELASVLDPLDAAWGPATGPRQSAVVALVSQSATPDLVLTLRAAGLAFHGGQVSLPGGGREAGDGSPWATARRETGEEIGLAGNRVTPLGKLRTREVQASDNRVVSMVGVWPGEDDLYPRDLAEVAAVGRWPVAGLADPACRVTVRHPGGGLAPAFDLGDWFMWGFTAWVVDNLLTAGGWARQWDEDRIVEIPARFLGIRRLYTGGRSRVR
ncbi:MAG: CoA pyrophosphatase [Propionibacteriaceae bacterium]|jgi:8-oxo-dGTP pyrophosphatase MutT (NUDIX family)|nr:CoA pyrophosphatase [Propionibacteriaceae bacterium]